jgi:hypothetical protein
MHTPRDVLEDDPIELDTSSFQRNESGHGPQERGLARAIRPEQRDDLPGRGFDRDVEIERAEAERDLGRQHQNARK